MSNCIRNIDNSTIIVFFLTCDFLDGWTESYIYFFFTYKNVKRLNYIGAAFLFLSIHDYVSDRIGIYFYNKLVLGKPWLTTFPVGFSGSIFESFFFTALMVFILAQAFKQGVNLKEEQDLTI